MKETAFCKFDIPRVRNLTKNQYTFQLKMASSYLKPKKAENLIKLMQNETPRTRNNLSTKNYNDIKY